MEFIIKAVTLTGLEMWVSPPRFGNHRTLGPREKADVFKTRGEAYATIGKTLLVDVNWIKRLISK